MDPATALQVASAAFTGAQDAFKLGKAIYDFVQDARQIDNTARDLASEIDALGSACNAVANMVEGIVREHAKNQHGQADPFAQSAPLFACLKRQLTSCHDTICQLHSAISCIGPSRAHSSSFMNQAWRQIKLNLKARDIEEVRNRIKSHTSSLQLALQSLSIAVSYVIPNRVDQLLRGRLDELANSQAKLLNLQEQRSNDASGTGQHDDETYILKASEKIMLSGESIYSTSEAGGSVMGDPLLGTKCISSWMEDIDAIDRVTSASSTDLTSMSSLFSDFRPGGEASMEDTMSTSSLQDLDAAHSEGSVNDDLESDDELAVEAADMCIAEGKSAFEKKEFAQADSFLKEALRMVRELPSVRQNICDIDNLRFMLGVCSFHLEKPAVAKEALLRVVNGVHSAKKQDNERLIPILEAGHLLTQVHLKLGELEQARSVCDSTVRGRSRILGRTHELYHESLALRIRIYEIEGNPNRAIVYAKFLPDDRRDSLIQAFQQLQLGDTALEDVKPELPPSMVAPPTPSSGTKSINSAPANVKVETPSIDAGTANRDMQRLSSTTTSEANKRGSPALGASKERTTSLPIPETSSTLNLVNAIITISAGSNDPVLTDYVIRIEPQSPLTPSWEVARKYRDFRTLHDALRNICNTTNTASLAEIRLLTPPAGNAQEAVLKEKLEQYFFHALHYQTLANSEVMKLFLGVSKGWSAHTAATALGKDTRYIPSSTQRQPTILNVQPQTGAVGAAGYGEASTSKSSLANPSTTASLPEPDIPAFSRVKFYVNNPRSRGARWLWVQWGIVFCFESQQSLEESVRKGKDRCIQACRERYPLEDTDTFTFRRWNVTEKKLKEIYLTKIGTISVPGKASTVGWEEDLEHLGALSRAILNEILRMRVVSGKGNLGWRGRPHETLCACFPSEPDSSLSRSDPTRISDAQVRDLLGWSKVNDASGRPFYQKVD